MFCMSWTFLAQQKRGHHRGRILTEIFKISWGNARYGYFLFSPICAILNISFYAHSSQAEEEKKKNTNPQNRSWFWFSFFVPIMKRKTKKKNSDSDFPNILNFRRVHFFFFIYLDFRSGKWERAKIRNTLFEWDMGGGELYCSFVFCVSWTISCPTIDQGKTLFEYQTVPIITPPLYLTPPSFVSQKSLKNLI